MGQSPSTLIQLTLLVAFVLPGVVYQFLREWWLGPRPGERDLGERVLRALTASVALNAVYLAFAGPPLARWLLGAGAGSPTELWVSRLRHIGLLVLVLVVIVPALAALLVTLPARRRQHAKYSSTPTAWDFAFSRRSSCFVRALLKDGEWAGGWYGSKSYASSFPQPAELFLESAWSLDATGRFLGRAQQTGGLLLAASNIHMLEFIDANNLGDTEDNDA